MSVPGFILILWMVHQNCCRQVDQSGGFERSIIGAPSKIFGVLRNKDAEKI